MKKNNFQNNGFSLMELLVIISVISVLSSMVLVSLKSAKDKAIIGSAIMFESANHHSLGATSVQANDSIVLDFDGVDAKIDNSGNNNSIVLSTTPSTPIVVPGITSNGLQFDGNNYAVSSKPVKMGKDWTISLWIYPMAQVDPWGNGMIPFSFGLPYIGWRNGSFWWSALSDTCGTQVTFSGIGSGLSINTWYQVTLVHNGTTNVSDFYLNGKLINTTSTAICDNKNSILALGRQGSQYYTFIGIMDNVRVYPQTLAGEDVGRLYTEYLPSHQFAKK